MKRKQAFLLVIVLLVVAGASLVGTLEFRSQGGGGNSHGAGKGGSLSGATNFSTPSMDFEIITIVAILSAIAVVGYYVLLPEMPASQVNQKAPSLQKEVREDLASPQPQVPPAALAPPVSRPSSYISERFTEFLDPEEKKVCDVLRDGGGEMLQKEIGWKAGYSKVKTHRVVYRLAKRGLVEVNEYFNTNKVRLKQETL